MSFTREVGDLIFREAILRRGQQVESGQRLADWYGIAVAAPVAYAVIDVDRDVARTLEVS